MRIISAILLSLSISACSVAPVKSPTANYRDSVFKIACDGGSGSGVLLENGKLLTAAHVVYEEKNCKAQSATKQLYDIAVTKIDGDTDLALLTFTKDSPTATGVKLSDKTPVQYSPVTVLGHPLGIDLQILTTGLWQGSMPDGVNDVITAPVTFGNSGGPVLQLNGSDAVLVGLVDAIADSNGSPTFHLVITISLTSIKKFLAKP